MTSKTVVESKQRPSNGQFVVGNEDGWLPGQSGNPNGRPKNSITTLLKNRDPKDYQKVADKLVQLAENGDMAAIRELLDRIDGKVIERKIVASKVVFEIEYVAKNSVKESNATE